VPALDSDLRRQLENVIIQARDVAEGAARSALQKRAVDAAEPFSHFGPKEKELRTRLRARGRQAGDVRNADKTQSIDQLTQELAYEFWHRMLFARFLAENNLLMHPDGVAVSLEECEELAKDADPPAPNGFVLAARYASTMLPQIFRIDDVLLEIDFAPEQRLSLEKLLASLQQRTFLADDSLGWAYQFWQSKKKEEVNKSGEKIDGRSLSAVTQLFTEHYMVQFLLHNTIGAWWCARHGIQGESGGAGVPAGKSPVEMEYLRWLDDGTPAAGTFEGWPKTLADFTMLDPCCGSGHFLVAAFRLLVALRMQDEKLTAQKACEAVLRDNLFGLELDPRCTQIAAFALALAAWKYPDAGGYRPLPTLNIACSGQGVTGKKEEWLSLVNGNDRLLEGMDRLYDLFQQAPHLGSLLCPAKEAGDIFTAEFRELSGFLEKALHAERVASNAEATAVGIAAKGIADAHLLLARRYSLVATNVPYLGRNKQGECIAEYCEKQYAAGKADLATAFVQRCLEYCDNGGTIGLVTPQNWTSLSSYKKLRSHLLATATLNCFAQLGPAAFQDMNWWGANTLLMIVTHEKSQSTSCLSGIDVSAPRNVEEKASNLKSNPMSTTRQSEQEKNPDQRFIIVQLSDDSLVSTVATFGKGSVTGDGPHYVRTFWEFGELPVGARYWLNSPEGNLLWGGRQHVVLWNVNGHDPRKEIGFAERGQRVIGKRGVAIAKMNHLHCTLYNGELFDDNLAVLCPNSEDDIAAFWLFCTSSEFKVTLRQIEPKMAVTAGTFVKMPCDIDRWRSDARAELSDWPPAAESKDPTQWLFKGDIASSTEPLQVAVARLLDYRWPEQSKSPDEIDKLADIDGILCLPGVRGEAAAAERLLEVLHVAYGKEWSDSVLHKLLTDAGCEAGTTLDEWLRNYFFEQHFKRFDNRPFIWHIWDGRKDGFSALVNYHKLDHKALENLTYSYLGDWIKAQTSDAKAEKTGAGDRLAAAQLLQEKLKLILAGEPPYDIFVRWKPLHDQAIGWHPDLTDGVRMNIRPFVQKIRREEPDILRKLPNIKRTKDRGKEPERDKSDYPWFWIGKEFVGDRVNDVHMTNAEKQAARSRKKGAK
jgi:hypothetical protein